MPKGYSNSTGLPVRKGLVGLRESSNHQWKGDKVGYYALHDWVERNLGKPKKCSNSFCYYPRLNRKNKLILFPTKYEWANVSGDYKRNLSDWVRLCTSCHRHYDSIKNRIRLINKRLDAWEKYFKKELGIE